MNYTIPFINDKGERIYIRFLDLAYTNVWIEVVIFNKDMICFSPDDYKKLLPDFRSYTDDVDFCILPNMSKWSIITMLDVLKKQGFRPNKKLCKKFKTFYNV